MRYLILLLLLTSCAPTVSINNHTFSVEIANDDLSRQKGLMHRESMPEDQGMLFVFDHPQVLGFWMKNTLIPLDMLFIDENLTVINIEYAEPCREDPCKVYKSKQPALYVLEINGNLSKKLEIKEGSKLSKRCSDSC